MQSKHEKHGSRIAEPSLLHFFTLDDGRESVARGGLPRLSDVDHVLAKYKHRKYDNKK